MDKFGSKIYSYLSSTLSLKEHADRYDPAITYASATFTKQLSHTTKLQEILNIVY